MKIEVNNIELFYEKTGNGKPLILLHGNSEDHHTFDKLVEKLKNHFTIYAIDSRNHGESQKVEDFSYETMAKDIEEFISKLHLEKPSIIGFSDGAIIALTMALNEKIPLEKLVLLGVNLKPSDFTEEAYNFIKSYYEKTNSPFFKLMLEAPNIELKEIKNIHNQILLVTGEKDIIKEELYKQMHKTLSNSELVILPNENHDSYIKDNDMLYPILMEFLD
ncbi:alpha/beta fold hydrolase [Fusobacterium sp. PH5-44]|uniref:alpha/beta fold hydrolase n=1 Tax=unclassified Fusobacterium TaxID=2648384 RepID=UPI003D247944